MKDIVTPVPQEEVRHVIKKCLENAALVNYTKVSEMTKIEGNITDEHHVDFSSLLPILISPFLPLGWRSGSVVSALASINEVNLRRTRLVLRWATAGSVPGVIHLFP